MRSRSPLPIAARALAAGLLALAIVVGPAPVRSQEAEQPALETATDIEVAPADDEPLPEDIDFNALAVPLDMPYVPKAKQPPRSAGDGAPVWSRDDRSNGTAAVSVKRPVSPFWDMKAGVDLDVATQSSPLRTPETLPDKLASDGRVRDSQGSAWLSARAPGVPYLSDHVALEARMNPGSDDARLGTAFSKSMSIMGDFSLTLRHGYSITQHNALPGLPTSGGHGRSFEMDRSAQFSITDTGTSFLAGQSLAPTGDRWLNIIGAQQKLFGGLSITGSVSETADGANNASLTAGFRKSW